MGCEGMTTLDDLKAAAQAATPGPCKHVWWYEQRPLHFGCHECKAHVSYPQLLDALAGHVALIARLEAAERVVECARAEDYGEMPMEFYDLLAAYDALGGRE